MEGHFDYTLTLDKSKVFYFDSDYFRIKRIPWLKWNTVKYFIANKYFKKEICLKSKRKVSDFTCGKVTTLKSILKTLYINISFEK